MWNPKRTCLFFLFFKEFCQQQDLLVGSSNDVMADPEGRQAFSRSLPGKYSRLRHENMEMPGSISISISHSGMSDSL